MARVPELPTNVLDLIAAEAAPRLAALLRDAGRETTNAELGAGVPCWFLDTGTFGTTRDLAGAARDMGTWHHQILVDGTPHAFVRSHVRPPDPVHVEVVMVAVSPLVENLDAALRWADENAGADLDARLLLIPSHHTTALWLTGAGDDRILLVHAPGSDLESERAYDPAAFLAQLGL